MKIDVTHEALLHALVEAVSDERDHGKALMSLVSRLVDEAGKQDWFETHWRTDARLKLAQIACGDLPKRWRSAAPVLEVIAEAARWALKADEIDSESRASLLAISRLADADRSGRTAGTAEPRPAVKSARRRNANGLAQTRRGRPRAQLAKQPAAQAQQAPAAKAKPAATATSARKAKPAGAVRRSRATAAIVRKPARAAKTAPVAKAKPVSKAKPAAKAQVARKMKPSSQTRRARPMAQRAKTTGAKKAAVATIKPATKVASAGKMATKPRRARKVIAKVAQTSKVAAKIVQTGKVAARSASTRKVKATSQARRGRPAMQAVKQPAASQQPTALAKPQPVAKASPPVKANGLVQASQNVETPASAT